MSASVLVGYVTRYCSTQEVADAVVLDKEPHPGDQLGRETSTFFTTIMTDLANKLNN